MMKYNLYFDAVISIYEDMNLAWLAFSGAYNIFYWHVLMIS